MATTKKTGRPTKAAVPIRSAKAKKYLAGGYQEQNDAVPSVAGLACYFGVSRSTIYAWSEKDKDFSDILETILATQERMLLSGGLRNTFNANIAKLMLGKHGYHDKTDLDNRSSDGSMTPSNTFILVSDDEDEG